ncbi:MAG: PP2C family protein-serine/threonine phosphatase [Clostridia bacterium]|nr:PP2C family protein-serine/threonine phosphatase [Clostridia bacterium]
MNIILGEAVVSCYVAASALFITVLLLILSDRLRQGKTQSMRFFFSLCLCIAANSLACFAFHAMYRHTPSWCHKVAVISRNASEFLTMSTVCLWLALVVRKLHGEEKPSRTIQALLTAPVLLILVLLVVNLFTGILFTIGKDNAYQRKPLHIVLKVVEFLLFASSVGMELYSNRKNTKIRFFRTSPMVFSVFVSLLPQFFTPYSTEILGFAIGATLLYFSMIGEISYVDEESGLYNRRYLAYLFDLAIARKNDVRSAMIINARGDMPAVFGILQDTLHREGDVIRVEDDQFLMLFTTDSRTNIQYLSSLLEEEEEKHNKVYPQNKVQITSFCRMRTGDETAFSFLRSVIEKNEGGDEMRGIVSMMSELEQLDKELKLAADIQTNMLPMVFPPFPDRTEFDLHAFMTPAKEVGGDFYDFFLLDSDHLALVIADVSGKGIPAALFMMVSKNMIKNQLMSGCDPATALEYVNIQLCERNSSMMFVTVWLAVIEISTGKGLAVNAGHENPFVARSGEKFEMLVYKHGTAIGFNEYAKYQNREFELHLGDCIFVYTDGVPEANSPNGELFGTDRLTDALNQSPDALPDQMISVVYEAVNRFADGTPQFDDITMLCFKYRGPNTKKVPRKPA